MKSIIKPNWDIFKAKFSDNPPKNFEWFCYLLFCKEYEREKGIFRYKNQSAIETNPIVESDKVIGWQAKFYDTTLASNKSSLLETLEKAKANYKDINTLIFYTNQEWGQGKKDNDSEHKKEVESKGRALGIDVDWRTASFFEAPFVIQENKDISQHFFELEESIIDRINERIIPRIEELNDSYKDTFKAIGGVFINRPEVETCIELIKLGKSIVIHGKAGQGKSGCTQGVIRYCEEKDISYIAIKLDDRMPKENVDKWGEELGLTESIPKTLEMISENRKGLIILDQLDALRWTNIHSRKALITCTEIIKRVEKINLTRAEKISIIFVCRTYDYENDSNIKELFNNKNEKNKKVEWEEVRVNELNEEVVKKIVGDRYDKLSYKMKKVLSIASNLYIWEHLKSDSMYDDYSTTNQLIQKWWEQIKQNCTENLISEEEIKDTKDALIAKINSLGKLHISKKLLSRNITEKSLTYLISSGFIIEHNNAISFAHQSISDYFLAQDMLQKYFSGDDIIMIIGAKNKQTPEKRYQIQMLLQDIQSEDENLFIEVGKRMMESDEIRFYIKYVFFEVAGQATHISIPMKKFILQYYDDGKFGKHILEGIIQGHPIFVQLLVDNEILDKMMNLDNEKDRAIKLLQSISANYRSVDVEFVRKYLFKSDEGNVELTRCFSNNIYDDSDEMFELRVDFYEKYPKYIDSHVTLRSLFSKKEVRGIRILELALKNEIEGFHVYWKKEKSLEKNNEEFEKNVENSVDKLLEYIPEKETSYSKWRASKYNKEEVERTCIEIIKKANIFFIERNPINFFEKYKMYFDKGYSLYNEIILEGFKVIPTKLSSVVIAYLCENFNHIIFEKSSLTDNELDLAKEVIEIHSKYCNEKVYDELEKKIINYIDSDAKEYYKWRIEVNRDKTSKRVYWSFWGDLQIKLLSGLPSNRISQEAKKILEVLRRRDNMIGLKNRYNKYRGWGGRVISPIMGRKLNNKQWINILTNEKIKVRNDRTWKEGENSIVESSIERFAEEFNSATSQEPRRFINLIIGYKKTIKEEYIDALFSGVANSKELDNISNEILEELILIFKYDYKTYRAMSICNIISKKSNWEWSDKILDIVQDIALNHNNPELDKSVATSQEDREMKSVGMLNSNALNCIRGSAATAMGHILWDKKELFESFKETIIKLCEDKNPAVRLATFDILWPAYNINREWAKNKILNMLNDDYRLAGYRSMKQMFFLIHKDRHEEIEKIILKCFYDKDKDLVKIGSHTLVEMYILQNRFAEIINNVEDLNEEQIGSMLEMAIRYFNNEEYNKIIKNLILKYVALDFDLEISICRIFNDKLLDIERDREFLIELVSFKSSRRIVGSFVRYLEENSEPIIAYKDIIFNMSYNIIEENSEAKMYIYGLNEEISKLVIGLYDEATQKNDENMNKIVDECLYIWDLMFEKRIGAARIMTQSMLDR